VEVKVNRLLACLGCLGWGALQAGAASAQSAAESGNVPAAADSSSIAEITVTAQRRKESINDVPISIDAATGEQLKALGINDVADLQKIVPGFHFSEGTFGGPIYSIRGVGFNDSSLGAKPSVSISLDEAPLPFPIMAGGTQLDLDRVEVAKGPQGILYGQNSTGGAVNYISAKPTDTFETGTTVSYGRFNDFNAQAFISGPIADHLRARFAVGTEQSSGWQESYTRYDQLGRKDKTVARLLLDWDGIDKLHLQLNVNGYLDDSDTLAPQLLQVTADPALVAQYAPALLTYPPAPHDDRAADWDPGVALKKGIQFYQGIFRAEYALNDTTTLTSVSSFSSFKQHRTNDYDGTAYQGELYTTRGDAKVASEELRATGSVGPARWVIGGNYEHDTATQDDSIKHDYNTGEYALVAFGERFLGNGNPTDSVYSTTAAFTNLDFDLGSNFTLHGGARYTKTDFRFDGCASDDGTGSLSIDFFNFGNFLRNAAGLPPLTQVPANGACVSLSPTFVPGEYFGSLDQSNVSWRGGLDWKPDHNSLIYLSATKGFKSGGAPNIAATEQVQLTPISQESVIAYELGTKETLFDGTMQANAAAFYYDYDNKQLLGSVVEPAFGPLSELVNVPKSYVVGGELGIEWQPIKALRFSFGGTYVKTKIKGDFFNFTRFGEPGNFGGERFPLTPEIQGYADVQYTRELTGDLSGFAGVGATYQSSTNGALGDLPLLAIDAYALVDLRAGVQSSDGHWKTFGWVKNVGNKYYWTNADHEDDTTVRFAGMPRTFGVTLEYRWK
jgi:iron complex outermembrane recepter protein